MSDFLAKAQDYKKQADKKLKAGALASLFGNKYEDGADLLEKAANNFKLAKAWADAAECYAQLAEIQMNKLDSKHDAALSFVESSKCVLKTAPENDVEAKAVAAQNASKMLQQAVHLYTDMGRLNMAARQLKELAEVQEKQGAKEEAIMFYMQAADLFNTEGSTSEATKCKLKSADFYAELNRCAESVPMYEEAAKAAVNNNLLKYSAKGYLLKAGMCLFTYASVNTIRNKIEDYKEIDFNFQGSRECNLVEAMLKAFEDADEVAYATALSEYDSITRFDRWQEKVLLEGRRRIEKINLGVGPSGGADDDDVSEEEVL